MCKKITPKKKNHLILNATCVLVVVDDPALSGKTQISPAAYSEWLSNDNECSTVPMLSTHGTWMLNLGDLALNLGCNFCKACWSHVARHIFLLHCQSFFCYSFRLEKHFGGKSQFSLLTLKTTFKFKFWTVTQWYAGMHIHWEYLNN